MVNDLLERLPSYEATGRASMIDKPFNQITVDDYVGELIVVFFRKDMFTWINNEVIWLSPTINDCGSKGWDNGKNPRIVLRTRLLRIDDLRTINVFGTHYDDCGMKSRKKSIGLEIDFTSSNYNIIG